MSVETNEMLEQEVLAGGEHGEIGSLFNWKLASYVYPKQLGRLFEGQTDFDMPGVPKSYRPDIAFVQTGRLADRVRGTVPLTPDLVVEIASPSDPLSGISDKANLYISAGVKLVWVVNPYDKEIWIYRAGRPKETLTLSGVLDGETVLPGFQLPVQELF